VKLLPHAQRTRISLYAGWIAAFMSVFNLDSNLLILPEFPGIQQRWK